MSERAGRRCIGADLCQELSGESDTAFNRTYHGDPATRIICKSGNLSLLADMSPLTSGHLLLVSNDHYLSFGEVVSDHAQEVGDVLKILTCRYMETFGNPLLFEHGSSSRMDGSACITHTHIHILPLELDAAHRVMSEDGLPWSELSNLCDLQELSDQGLPYFYCGNATKHRVYGVSTRRRQYLRSVAGRLLGIADPEWDYALVVRRELLRETVARTIGWRMISF